MHAAIYIHIPFCQKKCNYCSFYSVKIEPGVVSQYIHALEQEMARTELPDKITTLYIGGGTPSALSLTALQQLLELINKSLLPHAVPNLEFTIECNPASIEKDKLKLLKNFGVNRLSIGVQSFNDDELKILGRLHNAQQAITKVELAAGKGFENISIDLIYGIPGQTTQTWERSLQNAVALPIKHLSSYCLSFEKNTSLNTQLQSGAINKLPMELEKKMYHQMIDFLKDNSLHQYEISSFSLPGYESVHNLNYWTGGYYIGLGPAAHSYRKIDHKYLRWANVSNVEHYIQPKTSNIEFKEILTREDRITEFIMLGLRLRKGINPAQFKKNFHISLEALIGNKLQELLNNGLLLKNREAIFIPEDKLFISDEITSKMLLHL